MAYTLKLQALVYRPIIRSDMPEEFLNKMTDAELLQWFSELKVELLKRGIDESMMTFKSKFDEVILERKDIYEIFKEHYERK